MGIQHTECWGNDDPLEKVRRGLDQERVTGLIKQRKHSDFSITDAHPALLASEVMKICTPCEGREGSHNSDRWFSMLGTGGRMGG